MTHKNRKKGLGAKKAFAILLSLVLIFSLAMPAYAEQNETVDPTVATQAATEPTETSSTEPTPTETSSTEPTPTETSSTEPTPTETSSTEPTPTETSSTEPTPTETSSTEPTPTETSSTEPTPTEETPTEPTPTETSSTEPTPTEETPTEPAPTETTSTEPTTPAKSDAVLAVEAMITSLPTVEELDAMDDEGKGEVYAKVGEAKTAYEALSDEDKAMVEQVNADKLESLIVYFSPEAVPIPEALPDKMPDNKSVTPDGSLDIVPGKEKETNFGCQILYEYKVYDENGNVIANSGFVVKKTSGYITVISIKVPAGTSYGTYYVGVSRKYNGDNIRYIKVNVEQYDSSELKQSEVRDDTQPYWDSDQGKEKITSVTLGGKTVAWGDAGRESPWTGSSTLSDYYNKKNIADGSPVYAPLTITPAEGYYVTNILVVCCQKGFYYINGYNNPKNCGVYSSGNAFSMSFGVGTSGALTVQLPSYAFGHDGDGNGNTDRYMIFIDVAPVPTPLFVEYDYGRIKDVIANNAIFDDPDGWVTASDSNVYGTGHCETPNTQFKYAYLSNPTDAGKWDHFANTVTDTAKNAAIAEGYYFAGWSATYYNKCDENYNFSDVYSNTPTSFAEGQEVRLITHVRLTAQWTPIKLEISKTVAGLERNYTTTSDTYKLYLQKLNEAGWADVGMYEFTVPGNNPQTITLSADSESHKVAITPGTYRIVEKEESQDNRVIENEATIMYFKEAVGNESEVTYSVDDFSTKTLNITNTYSSEPAKTSLTITKTVTGGLGDKNKSFTFTVKIGEGDAVEYYLANGQSQKIENIPISSTVTVSEEVYPDYTTTYQVNNELAVKGNSVGWTAVQGDNNTIAFENHKEWTPDTGVILDSLPYVLILVIVVGGAVLMLARKRRHGFED